jgi:hypothetical protein
VGRGSFLYYWATLAVRETMRSVNLWSLTRDADQSPATDFIPDMFPNCVEYWGDEYEKVEGLVT